MWIDISRKKGVRARCKDCGKELNIKDYICSIDPYSCQCLREKPLRVNLCEQCYINRRDEVARILRGESPKKNPDDDVLNIPYERQPKSKSKRKKRKLEKRKRQELIRQHQENAGESQSV